MIIKLKHHNGGQVALTMERSQVST